MKLRAKHKFLGLGFLSVLFIFLAGFLFYMGKMIYNTDLLIKNGDIFGESENDMVAVNIYGIDPEPWVYDDYSGINFYLVVFDYGLVFLDAKTYDEDIAAIIAADEAGTLGETPYTLAVNVLNSNEIPVMYDAAKEVEAVYPDYFVVSGQYLSKVEIDEEKIFFMIFALISLVIGLVFLIISVIVFFKINSVKNQINEIDENILLSEDYLNGVAEYADEKLGVYIYKKHLIINGKSLFVTPMDKIEYYSYGIISRKAFYFITYSTLYFVYVKQKSKMFKASYQVNKVEKETEAHLLQFVDYFLNNYPDIKYRRGTNQVII